MNRAQRRRAAKAHKIATKRTIALAKKEALEEGRNPEQANLIANAISMCFKNEHWHPESKLGELAANLEKEATDHG